MNVKPRKRTDQIVIRVTPEEKKRIKESAKALSLSVTAFLVMEALGETVTQLVLDGFDEKGK